MAESTIINIYDSNGTLVKAITKVLSATLRDALDGECTFDFSILTETSGNIEIGNTVSLSLSTGMPIYIFNIVRISKSFSNNLKICSVTCEHKSYELNDEKYNLTSFDFIGDPLVGLQQLLEGTNLSAGTLDFTGSVALKINKKCSRRAALMQYVAILGGEIEYEGNAINIRSHRGSVKYLDVMGGKAISDVSITYDLRADTATYNLKLYKKLDFSTGDNVHIVFIPFGLDVRTRIIAMSYNPFNRREITIEVGAYLPSVSDQLYSIENNLNDMADRMESLEQITAKYTAEFGDIIGSGSLYFRIAYLDKPIYFIFPYGGSAFMEFIMSDGKYVGAEITASSSSVITSLLFYCTLPDTETI
jgi:hypothetical protein